jgi:hypothetical protein
MEWDSCRDLPYVAKRAEVSLHGLAEDTGHLSSKEDTVSFLREGS